MVFGPSVAALGAGAGGLARFVIPITILLRSRLMPEAFGQHRPHSDSRRSAAGDALQSAHRGATAAVSDGWVEGGAFFGSIMAGCLLGWVGDQATGLSPWLTVIGICLGSASGFYRLWRTGRTPSGKQPVARP